MKVSVRSSIVCISMTAADSARTISAPAASPPALTTRARECAPSPAQHEPTDIVPIDAGSESDEARYRSRSVGHHRVDDFRVREPSRCGDGVACVASGVVVGANGRGYTALRPRAGAADEGVCLRQAGHAQRRKHQSGRHPGRAGPDDQDVGRRQGHRLGFHPDSPRPTLSIRSIARFARPAILGSTTTSWVILSTERRTDDTVIFCK